MIQLANRLENTSEYYFSKKLREIAQLNENGKNVINLGVGSPDLNPHESVVNALKMAVHDAKAHQYQSYQGLFELRDAISKFYYNSYNVELNPDSEILPLMGSKEGIMYIALAFLNVGDKVLVPNPGYPTYKSVLNIVQAESVYYNLNANNNWEPDFNELEGILTKYKDVRLMFTNYPNMPTGTNANKVMYQKLIDFAKKHNILIVNDNPYSFVLNDNPISILDCEDAKDVAIELNSLSKTFNISGWRVGMVVGAKYYMDAILKVKSNMDSGMFYGIQKGAIQALSLPKKWINEQNDIYKSRKIKVIQLAKLLNCEVQNNSVGMFVWAKLPDENRSSDEFVNHHLYKNYIFITPGSIFGSNGNNYIRFSLCIPETLIDEAIKRVKNSLPVLI